MSCRPTQFNRIDIEVLSVVAQQLQQLRQGIVQGLSEMLFEGRNIKLRPHCVIITVSSGTFWCEEVGGVSPARP